MAVSQDVSSSAASPVLMSRAATTGWSVEITHLKAEIVSVLFDFVSCRKTKQRCHVLFLVHMNKVLRKMYDGSFVHCIYIYA